MLIVQLAIVQIMVFAVLVYVFKRIINSTYTDENNRLQNLSQENAKKSLDLDSKMRDFEAQSKKKMDEADEEIRKLKIKTAEEAEKLKEEALMKGRQEADRLTQQAMSTKDKIREDLLNEQAERVNEQALKLVREVLTSKSLLLVHKGLVHEIIEQMGEMDSSKLQIHADRGELISPVALDREDKEKILSVLAQKTGRTIALDDVVNHDYVAGICIQFGNLVIDGSLAKRLKDSAENLKR